MTKRTKTVRRLVDREADSCFDIDYMDVVDVIAKLTKLCDQFPGKRLQFKSQLDPYSDSEHARYFTVVYEDEETDQEYEARMLVEKQWEQEERALLAKLQKKYGGAVA